MAKLTYEFAPVDVSIMTHPKACSAGPEAMGLWLWGQCFARVHETSGLIHRSAMLIAWGGKRNIMLAKRLVDAGLWIEREDGDWDIHNFEAKSSGPKSSSTERMRGLRERRRAEEEARLAALQASHGDVTSCHGDENSDALCSVSTSVSSSEINNPEEIPPRDALVPAFFQAAAATAAMATWQIPEHEMLRYWLQYQGAPSRQGKPLSQKDAQAWIIGTLRGERERAETERAKRERFKPPPNPSEPNKITPEEQRRIEQAVPFTVTKRKGAA